MPNPVYYSDETAAAKSLKIGNFYCGTNDVDKGPTSTTSFFSGINPPSGGYTIYLNKSGNKGPSIACPSNDADLIGMTNEIADASYTTVAQCFTFFAGQSDKFVMFNPINTIVTDGLVACFAAGTLPSYPRSGTTFYNLGNSGGNGTLENSPSFDSDGWFDFDGVDDFIALPSDIATALNGEEEASVCIWIKLNNQSNGVGDTGIIQLSGYTSGNGNLYFYSNGYTYLDIFRTSRVEQVFLNSSVTATDWHLLTVTTTSGTNGWKCYINTTLKKQATGDSTVSVNNSIHGGLSLGENSGGRYTYGDIASCYIYDKALTTTEIATNYYQGAIVTDDLAFAIDAGNLISYYNNVPSNTAVKSLVGTVTGTLTNGVAFNGNSGGYWEFDGVDDQLPLSTNINLGNGNIAWTVSAWVKSTTTANGLGQGSVASNDGSGPVYSMMGINSGKIVYWTYQSSAWAQKLGVATVNDGDWHLLTWVNYSDITMDMYVDGVFDKNVTNSTSGNNNPIDTIGNSWAARFDGEIAALHIYQGKSLTAAEVGQNYESTKNRFN